MKAISIRRILVFNSNIENKIFTNQCTRWEYWCDKEIDIRRSIGIRSSEDGGWKKEEGVLQDKTEYEKNREWFLEIHKKEVKEIITLMLSYFK